MQDKLKSQKPKTTPNVTPNGSRSYSTMTTPTNGSNGMDMGLVDFQSASKAPTTPGLKFEMPSLPLPKDGHVKHRHDPIVDQVTNLLMRHGKKSVAERVGQPSTNNNLQSTNLAPRQWRSSCNTYERRPSPPSTRQGLCSQARPHHRIFHLTPYCISPWPLTLSRL